MKKILLLLVILIVGAAVGVWYFLQDSFDIYLTEEQLQARIEESFPIEQRPVPLTRIVLSEPQVNLIEGSDRVHYAMRARASITGLGEVLDGRGRISGTIRYEPREAAFYFDRLRIEELDTGRIPEQYEQQVREAAGVALREALRRQPIYRLREDDLRQAATRIVLRDVRVVDGRLRIRVSLRQDEVTD